MRAHLNRRYRFSASHRLHNPVMTDEQNRECYGKCNNPHGHGHNYIVEITLSGEVDPVTGMVCNLGDLDSFMVGDLISRFDESNLNEDEFFRGQVPTTEAVCKVVFGHVRSGFHLARIERVRVEETGHNAFEYQGDEAGRRIQ